ncbi:hypothetical protein AHMF7605_03820 [Adhaeribacter arboris]|uniref:Uncharacterized protein n=1 Tax=Adhaeribacter arboris TaxID=2072846 RepID=A0A2T2YB33_9BACT|nr:hypothetical protein [Adhaeribacter arboris]PSR52714.1 hypothetical protein AHMF7605_03820 [Adhaeribacter arboris]
MNKLTFCGLLLVVASLTSSCQKEEEITKNPPATKADESTLLGGKATTIEALCEAYFKAHQEEAPNAEKIISVTKEFFTINHQTKEFKNKKPCRIQPIYAYGIDGVAYYEIWFTENNKTPLGWILISATDKDYPLVNFSQGLPYSSRMLTETNQDNKIYRFGVSYYAMEKNGQKVADYGKMPAFIANADRELEGSNSGDSKNPDKNARKSSVEAKEGVDYTAVTGYESLKQVYAKNYYSSKRSIAAQEMKRRLFPTNGHGEAVKKQGANLRTAGEYYYRWVPGYSAYYTQIDPGYRYNYFPCWSGCSNNAWTNIYGWWDANRSKSTLIPTTSTGEASPLYRNTYARQDAIDPIQMYIRAISGTYCGDGTGWTLFSDVYKGVYYAPAKGYGYNFSAWWCNSPGCNVNLANIVTEGIANNYTPVHIGANSHAYVGLGWAQWSDNTDWTWVYCYPGWREDNLDNVWIGWRDLNSATRLDIY